jgi:NAD(P)-dependent dehydrogenase (short-subunit alcohol dehydrogenase family)
MRRFDGKVVLVTGGGNGIGEATVQRFAHEGAQVVVVDIHPELAEKTVEEIQTNGGGAISIQADVAIADDVQRMIDTTMNHYGHLDVIFNNAGIGGGPDHLVDLSVEDWDRLISVNLRGVFLGCKFGLPAIIESGGDAIVNMGSSTAGWDVIYGGGAYMASKEGIAGITRNLALEAAPYGVRVNAVCPGIIETQLSFSQGGKEDAARREWFKRFSRRIPLRRVGLPEDVAAAVAFLASEDARHITGAQLLIDGGQTLQSWSNAPDSDAYPLMQIDAKQ